MRRNTKATGAGANNPDTGGATGTSKRATRSTTKTANTNTVNEATAVNANVEDHPMYRRTTVKVLQQKLLTLENVQFTTKDKKPTLFTLVRDNGLLDEDVDKENATPVVNAVVVASTGVTERLPNERSPHSSNSSSTASNSSDANKCDSNHSNSSGDSTSTASSSSDANTRDSNHSNSSDDSTSTDSNCSDALRRHLFITNRHLFITRRHLIAERREHTILRVQNEIESNRRLLDCNRKFLGSFDKDGNWEMGAKEKRLRQLCAQATEEFSRNSFLPKALIEVKCQVNDHRVDLKRELWTQSSRFSPAQQLNYRYCLTNVLGKGSFGEVWRALDLNSDEDLVVAAKILQPQPEHIHYVQREIDILRRINNHEHVAALLTDFTIAPDVYVLVLEYCGGPSLQLYLEKSVRLMEWEANAILRQILSAMAHLNSLGIIHYDMKPGNIMLDDLGIVKVVDFGWSKITDDEMVDGSVELACLRGGTTSFKPPEGFRKCGIISNKVDVWAIGITLYAMIYGRKPFGSGLSEERFLAEQPEIHKGGFEFLTQFTLSDLGKRFIESCLCEEPLRPYMSAICNHEYVTGTLELPRK